MDRWLLNTFSTPELVVIHIGGAILVGVGGFLLMKRFVPSLQGNADNRSLSSAFGLASGLFSFVLAFTIGQLYGNFTRASADARQEATVLTQVLRTSRGLPPGRGADHPQRGARLREGSARPRVAGDEARPRHRSGLGRRRRDVQDDGAPSDRRGQQPVLRPDARDRSTRWLSLGAPGSTMRTSRCLRSSRSCCSSGPRSRSRRPSTSSRSASTSRSS